MQDKFQMYSNDVLAENLQTLIINRGIPLDIICDYINNKWGVKFSYKQMQKYVKGTTTQRIGTDKLYVLAKYFDVSMDALVTKGLLDDDYPKIGNPNINHFHLNANSRNKLSNIENETEITILNKLIDSNVVETFTKQLENASAQLKDVNDKEKESDIILLASHKVQVEIDKLFRKCLNKYNKK